MRKRLFFHRIESIVADRFISPTGLIQFRLLMVSFNDHMTEYLSSMRVALKMIHQNLSAPYNQQFFALLQLQLL